ncbi:MAG TPA: type IV pilin protein [Burkholderiaceae bacterium]|nr:type IV pilin protein [Burkholderiaceae bacterium]HMX09903.1 type IV pilin protein [Burkholderiaceae bacterium]HMY98775.1 type IV pilin protein [Burkholderiaceae bacterium]HNB43361.1 type IV pilin protein [Burkholderiaceae bacterium]HNG78980.1 type IV pilin protein [Burkholderiaceae bacterium]
MNRGSARGFTLIEIVITLVVVTLLTTVALPAYREQIAKSRRSDAKASLLTLAQLMERWYTERGTYAGATVGGTGIAPSTSSQGYYTMSISAQDAAGFTIVAAPTAAQTGDACGSFTYTQAGTRGVTGGTKTAAQCW